MCGAIASGPMPAARMSRSLHFDWQLAPYDIAGSHAHTKALAAAGYLVLRFGWEHLAEPDYVANLVRQALRTAAPYE